MAFAIAMAGCTGGTSLDANAATDLFLAEVLPNHVPEVRPYRVVRAAEAIPPGAVITPAGLETGTSTDFPPGSVIVQETSYLFFVDLAPGSYYGHPVEYAVVGESGSFQVVENEWPPAVDGIVPPELREDDPNPALVVASQGVRLLPAGSLPIYQLNPWIELLPNEGYIVVQGLLSDEGLYQDAVDTADVGKAFFDAYSGGTSRVAHLADEEADTVLDVMDEMATEFRSPIVVAIIAHGGYDTVRLGGVVFTAADFVSTVRAHPQTEFNFLIGSCHSGSFVDDLRGEQNVRVVATAVAPSEFAAPDWDESRQFDDVNQEDIGSEWFSSFYRAASDIAGDSTRLSMITQLSDSFESGQTQMLLCQSVYGAIGYNPLLLPDRTDFSLTHALGAEHPDEFETRTPQRYCSWF